MSTYWNANISTTSSGKLGVSCICGAPTLTEALAIAVKDASYYRLYCGYEVSISLTEYCSECHNEGQVQKGNRRVRCHTCKGKFPTGHIPAFAFEIHENVLDLAATPV